MEIMKIKYKACLIFGIFVVVVFFKTVLLCIIISAWKYKYRIFHSSLILLKLFSSIICLTPHLKGKENEKKIKGLYIWAITWVTFHTMVCKCSNIIDAKWLKVLLSIWSTTYVLCKNFTVHLIANCLYLYICI